MKDMKKILAILTIIFCFIISAEGSAEVPTAINTKEDAQVYFDAFIKGTPFCDFHPEGKKSGSGSGKTILERWTLLPKCLAMDETLIQRLPGKIGTGIDGKEKMLSGQEQFNNRMASLALVCSNQGILDFINKHCTDLKIKQQAKESLRAAQRDRIQGNQNNHYCKDWE